MIGTFITAALRAFPGLPKRQPAPVVSLFDEEKAECDRLWPMFKEAKGYTPQKAQQTFAAMALAGDLQMGVALRLMERAVNEELAASRAVICSRCGDVMDETCEPDNCKDPECPILYGEKK